MATSRGEEKEKLLLLVPLLLTLIIERPLLLHAALLWTREATEAISVMVLVKKEREREFFPLLLEQILSSRQKPIESKERKQLR